MIRQSPKTYVALGVALLGAGLGLMYSVRSAADFAAHLDRQVHPVSCTLMPSFGDKAAQATEPDAEHAAEGCTVAMYSPYSSFWRAKYWGGIPVALFGLGLFGFATMLAAYGLVTRRGGDPAPRALLLTAGIVATGTSAVFFSLSLSELGTFCTTCVGIYISSALLLIGGVLTLLFGRSDARAAYSDLAIEGNAIEGSAAEPRPEPAPRTRHGLAALSLTAQLGIAVALPPAVYVASLPDYGPYVSSCGVLKQQQDPHQVLLPTRSTGGKGADAVLVLDPLCPACKAFHERYAASPAAQAMSTRVLLMPLDRPCNWMIKDSLHPGACLLSKALLCAGKDAEGLLELIWSRQEDLRKDGIGEREDRIRATVLAKYPAVATCIDKPETDIQLHKVLEHAVLNSLPVLTPQLYVDGRRLCDEDTDLGFEFALSRLTGRTP